MLQPSTPSNLKLPTRSSARSALEVTGTALPAGSRQTSLRSELLQHQSSPSPVFLCIDFWVSRERYLRARDSPVYEPLFQLRHDMAAATIELGVFAFPAPAETDIVLPQTADLCTKADSRGAR